LDVFDNDAQELFYRWGAIAGDFLGCGIDRRIHEFIDAAHSPDYNEWIGWPLPNVHLGVSVEDQATADTRIRQLLLTPAHVRFVSCEPLLGPVDLRPWLKGQCPQCHGFDDYCADVAVCETCHGLNPIGFDWVIIGGESGPGARPCDVAWIRSLVRQRRAAGAKCFVKQLGGNVYGRNDDGFEGDTSTSWPIDTRYHGVSSWQGTPVHVLLHNRKGGDPSEWPEDLRVREYPEEQA
jgi:hypothetical protein